MTDSSGKFTRLLAFLLAILFIFSLILTLFLHNIEKTVFDAKTYKIALQEEKIYTRLPSAIGSQLLQKTEKDENPLLSAFLSALNSDDWEKLIAALLPPPILKSLSEEAIDATLGVLNGESTSASISLGELKTQLGSPNSSNALMAFLRTQPPCSPKDLFQMTNIPDGGNFILCQPPEVSMPLVESAIEKELELTASLLPDQKTFWRAEDESESLAKIQSLRLLMRLSPLLPAFLLLLITLLVVRSPDTWLRWWGIPFLFAGSITAGLAFLAKPVLQAILALSPLGKTSANLSPELLQLITDLFTRISQMLTERITSYALFIALLGLLMTVGAKFIKNTEPFPHMF